MPMRLACQVRPNSAPFPDVKCLQHPLCQRTVLSAGAYGGLGAVCATDDDVYHSASQMCVVRNAIAKSAPPTSISPPFRQPLSTRLSWVLCGTETSWCMDSMWLRGQGQQCSTRNKGSKVITKSSDDERQNAFVYPPNYAKDVRAFYGTCVATCALGDSLSPDGVHCKVKFRPALNFFEMGDGRCRSDAPGMQSISNTEDGGYYYPMSHGPMVQAWYRTCVQARSAAAPGGRGRSSSALSRTGSSGIAGGGAGTQRSARGALQTGSEVLFPYPSEAGSGSVVICNYSGKRYYWGKSGIGDTAVESVEKGGRCTAMPLEEACSDSVCWHRGWVSPCKSQSCFKGSARQVNAGIDVVSSGGGKGVCTVICTAEKDMCKTSTVVYIAPLHCTYVQVVHSSLSIIDFPPPYENLPKITFPYPRPSLDGTSIYICNYSVACTAQP